MTRVLYVLWNYPQLSETYIAAEISFAQRHGIEVEVWSKVVRTDLAKAACRVHRGPLGDALHEFKPDVIHVHYLPVTLQYADFLKKIPITVRVHSFDWSRTELVRVAAIPAVRHIYLFPHFLKEAFPSPKLKALPVAFDSTLYKPAPSKDRRLVLRLAAGLPTKGLKDFFDIAACCPDHRFVLGVAQAGTGDGFCDQLRKWNEMGYVDLRVDVPNEEAAALTAKAGIYLNTHDPKGHRFGMPVGVAEAMATGSLVFVKDCIGVAEYVGDGASIYKTYGDAAASILETLTWSEEVWTVAANTAIARAVHFADESVLPVLIDDWKRIARGSKGE